MACCFWNWIGFWDRVVILFGVLLPCTKSSKKMSRYGKVGLNFISLLLQEGQFYSHWHLVISSRNVLTNKENVLGACHYQQGWTESCWRCHLPQTHFQWMLRQPGEKPTSNVQGWWRFKCCLVNLYYWQMNKMTVWHVLKTKIKIVHVWKSFQNWF